MKVITGGAEAQKTTFRFYFVHSLGAMILKQTYQEWKLFANAGLELKESWKR